MLNSRCAQMCMRSVPASKEYNFEPVAKYDMTNYKSVLSNTVKNCVFEDISAQLAATEIVDYISKTNMESKFNLNYKNGIIFFFNGFPLLGFKHSINSIIPMQNDTYLLIDINNYLFNKELILKTDMKQRLIKKYNEMKEIIILLAIYVGLIYLLRLYQMFLSTL
jgi:hypothetical protein